jgi:VanZ family protein
MPARLLRIAFWAALVFAFVMALLPKPPQIPGSPSDKVQHIAAFTVLSALAAAAYRQTPLVRIGLLLSLFGAVIELLQLIPPLHRDGSWLDWAADTAAITIVLTLAAVVRKRSERVRF